MNDNPSDSPALKFTGERFIPGTRGEIWIEHWHRYHFAAPWAAGRRVLDVACGEGYGSAFLARRAAHVTGVDLAAEAIAHAKRTYGGARNLEFACGPATKLSLGDASIDVAVCFETIEHIREQRELIDEVARVLKPDGVLILSCPNKLEYTDKRDFVNEFHEKELYRDELAQLVGARFPHIAWHGQRPSFYSVIAPEATPGRGEVVETSESQPAESESRITNPLYFIVVASRAPQSLAAPTLSVLADRDDWLHRDYEKVTRAYEKLYDEHPKLEATLGERDVSISRLEEEVREERRGKAAAEATIAMRDLTIAARDAKLAARSAEVADKNAEIARRGGWRWWLRLPLIRLGLLK